MLPTRDNVVIVQAAVDIAALTKRWQALDEREARTLAEIRLEKGRLLVEARRAFPRSGPKAVGWGALLQQWKIGDDTARNYMKLAGYVDAGDSPKTSGNQGAEIPTYAEAGIVSVPPKSEPTPVTITLPPPELDRFGEGYEVEDDADDGGDADEAPVPECAADRPAAPVYTDEDRAEIRRLDIQRFQPPAMPTREDRTRRLQAAITTARTAIETARADGLNLTDATTSDVDFEDIKKNLIAIVRFGLDQLEGAGVLDAPEPRKRQLLILDGGKPA